jgi:acyl carrier protein
MNSDASDFVLPNPDRQADCMRLALRRARVSPDQVDIVSTHATGTMSGDQQEVMALRQVFGDSSKTCFNNTKSFIGHAMGAAGALELAGNLPAFDDRACHATLNVDELDPECERNRPGFVYPQQFIWHAWNQLGSGDQTTMTATEIRDEILDILSDIVPDEDLSALKDDVPLREQMELDSMDFLDIVMELRKRHRIQVPEEGRRWRAR